MVFKEYNEKLESTYAISMILLFSTTYVTLIIFTITLLYDGFLELNNQGSEFGFISGIIGIILTIGIIWALFPKEVNGIKLIKKDAPHIFKIIEKAISKTKIHPIDEIFIVPDSAIAVTGFFKKKLLIGIASLRYLTEKDFEAILYHEIGHFEAKDTKKGSFLGIIFSTLEKQYISSINFWNYSPHYAIAIMALPSLIITWTLLHIFSLMYAPYSKFKEYKADEFAATNTSPTQFANALIHYSAYSYAHEFIMPQIITQLLIENKKLNNVYFTMTKYWNNELGENAISVVLNEKENFKDSHPSIQNRLKNLQIKTIGINTGKMLNQLFVNFEKLEEKLSDNYTTQVGIRAGLLDRTTTSLDEQ